MRPTLAEALRRQIAVAAPSAAVEPAPPVWKPTLTGEIRPPEAVRPPQAEPLAPLPERRNCPAAEGEIRRAAARVPVPDPEGLLPYERRNYPWTLYR